MRKECIKLGLSGRFTMKEAFVEIATALVRIGKDPRVHQFHTSQPLLGYYPYQVVISSEIIETMKVLPTSLSSARMSPSVPVTPSASKPVPSPRVTTANVPSFSPAYPPPAPGTSHSDNSQGNVLEKILCTLEKIHDVMEKKISTHFDASDSEFESFTSAVFTNSSDQDCSSVPSSAPTSTSSESFCSSCAFSSSGNDSNRWSKDKLREELICIKFQHGSCRFYEDHPDKAHLCAKCYLSYDEALNADHGADRCPYY